MRRRQTTTMAAAILAATVGLGAQSSSPATADVNELDQYHLTIETLHKVDLATIAIAKNMETDPVVKNWHDAKRETETLQKKNDLTAADGRRLEQLQADIESKPYDREGTLETISEMGVAFAKIPPIVSALQAQGMTPRDFAKFILAMSTSAMAGALQKAGGVINQPLPPGVNAQNVKFVADHEADIERIGNLLQSEK
jgi:hypothetical protein